MLESRGFFIELHVLAVYRDKSVLFYCDVRIEKYIKLIMEPRTLFELEI